MLKIKKITKEGVIPTKAHESDSGLDVTIIGIHKDYKSGVVIYKTGISLEPEPGYYTELVARSSLMKRGYMLANSIGIIDESYRGELLVALFKFDTKAEEIKLPMRVAQLIPRKRVDIKVVVVDDVNDTKRGDGGFGSSN